MKLKEFRLDHGLSQKDLAQLFLCGTTNISNIEKGLSKVQPLQIRQLIDHYGRDVISKYAEEGDELPGSAPVSQTIGGVTASGSGTVLVQNGNGNVADGATMEELVRTVSLLTQTNHEQSQQITRLIGLLEKQH